MLDIYTGNTGRLKIENGDIVIADDINNNIGIKNVNVLALRNYLNINRKFFLDNNMNEQAIHNFILQSELLKGLTPASVKVSLKNKKLTFKIEAK